MTGPAARGAAGDGSGVSLVKQRLGVAAVAAGFVIVATAFWLTFALGWRPGQWLVIGIIVAAVASFLVVFAIWYWRARRSR